MSQVVQPRSAAARLGHAAVRQNKLEALLYAGLAVLSSEVTEERLLWLGGRIGFVAACQVGAEFLFAEDEKGTRRTLWNFVCHSERVPCSKSTSSILRLMASPSLRPQA